MRMKQQASGWPIWATTDKLKEKYLRDYEEKEKIKLDPSKIEKNGGLRTFAKLCLNSFWGKVRNLQIYFTHTFFFLVRSTQ